MNHTKLYRRIRDSSIRSKFILAASLLLTAILISGIYIGGSSYMNSYEDHIETAKGDFKSCYQDMEKFEKRMYHLANLVQADGDTLERLREIRGMAPNEYQQVKQELLPLLYTLPDGSGDYFCRLYVDSSLDLIDTTSRILTLDSVRQEDWVAAAFSGWGSWLFYSAEELASDSPGLIVPIRSRQDYSDFVGILRIDLITGPLTNRIEASRSGDYATCYLQTPEGGTVACTDSKAGELLLEVPPKTLEGFEASQLNTATRGKDQLFYQTLPYSGWRLVTVVHHDRLHAGIFPQLLIFTVSGCLLALLGILCAAPILIFVLSRIRRFSGYVHRYSGDPLQALPPQLDPLCDDEIGQLIRAHNHLLTRIEGLIRTQKQRDRELHHLELSVLQAQIKPHFLYNTLEAITWMAKLNQPEKVEDTVRSLTRFYRLFLSQGQEVLPLRKELEIVRHYFDIQSTRYEQVFRLDIDVPQEILGLGLPKITLQPLVENALIHGILESGKNEGDIRIYGRRQDGRFELCVADTGAHFRREEWEAVMGSAHTEGQEVTGESYGLKNVECRLCLFFGEEQVMELDESDPCCTCIVIPFKNAEAALRGESAGEDLL